MSHRLNNSNKYSKRPHVVDIESLRRGNRKHVGGQRNVERMDKLLKNDGEQRSEQRKIKIREKVMKLCTDVLQCRTIMAVHKRRTRQVSTELPNDCCFSSSSWTKNMASIDDRCILNQARENLRLLFSLHFFFLHHEKLPVCVRFKKKKWT